MLSIQLLILCLCLLKDRDFGVGIFPESEKVLVRPLGLGPVSHQQIGPAQLEVRERTHGIVDHYAAMVENARERLGEARNAAALDDPLLA